MVSFSFQCCEKLSHSKTCEGIQWKEVFRAEKTSQWSEKKKIARLAKATNGMKRFSHASELRGSRQGQEGNPMGWQDSLPAWLEEPMAAAQWLPGTSTPTSGRPQSPCAGRVSGSRGRGEDGGGHGAGRRAARGAQGCGGGGAAGGAGEKWLWGQGGDPAGSDTLQGWRPRSSPAPPDARSPAASLGRSAKCKPRSCAVRFDWWSLLSESLDAGEANWRRPTSCIGLGAEVGTGPLQRLLSS